MAANTANTTIMRKLTEKQRAALSYGYQLRTIKCVQAQLKHLSWRVNVIGYVTILKQLEATEREIHFQYGVKREKLKQQSQPPITP